MEKTRNQIKLLTSFATLLTLLALTTTSVFAHVVVKPSQAGIGSFQTFTLGVPSEKEVPTVTVRLVLPAGLEEVTVNVKSGWQIEVKKDTDKATEIIWSGGSIPSEQRDEFSFSTQVPSSATILQWKVYQTYQDRSVVAWDQKPTGLDDAKDDKGPYSETKVVNDLTASENQTTNWISYIALAVAAAALALSLRKPK